MNKTNERKIIIAIILLVVAIVLLMITSLAGAATKDKWIKSSTGVILDVDPLPNGSDPGLFFEMDGSWIWIWQSNFVGDWPKRGQFGTFYKNEDKYKWVVKQNPKNKKQTNDKQQKEDLKQQIIKIASPMWTSVVTLPPVDKTVLVRYKNGKTITTAYVTYKKEWKLETDRDRVAGGRAITTVAEWREIQG